MVKYKYPDPNDSIIADLITRFEMYQNYWTESEEMVLKIIFSYINKLPNEAPLYMLDIGCGDGRLFGKFNPFFHLIQAIEPDLHRFNASLQKISELQITSKVLVQNTAFEAFESTGNYDFILCSHIIQHIKSDKVFPFLKKIYSLLKNNGFVALTTCHSTRNTDYFYKSYFENNAAVEKEIKEPEFNKLVSAENTLPVHFFNFNLLKDQLEQIGFKIEHLRVFHIENLKNISHQTKQVDDYVNEKEELQRKHGRDMLIILKK